VKVDEAYTQAIASGAGEAEALAAAAAAIRARMDEYDRRDTQRDAARAAGIAPAGRLSAEPVSIPDAELAVRALARHSGVSREQAEEMLNQFPEMAGSLSQPIALERKKAQEEADAAAVAAHENSPEGRRAKAEAALAAKRARQKDADLARVFIEAESERAGVPFDASALSDAEALIQAGFEAQPLSGQAARVAEANARYEQDPLGTFSELTLSELKGKWPNLAPYEQQRELSDLRALGLRGVDTFEAEMQDAGDPQ
jgi:hypothetical protein